MAQDNTHNTPSKLYKGLFLDANPLEQPEGTYRFALNGVNQTREGDKHFLSNEEAMEMISNFPGVEGSVGTVLGSIYIDDEEHVIFFLERQANGVEKPAIYFLDAYGNLELLLIDITGNTRLNFNWDYPITGEYRLRNGCEKTFYWVDGLNVLRSYNITQGRNGEYADAGTPFYLLSEDGTEKLELMKTAEEFPVFVSVDVTPGGQLLTGTYNFAIQLVDENFNNTAWLTTSMVVPVVASDLLGEYDAVLGSSNRNYEREPTTVEQVAYGQEVTSKKIVLELDNLDTAYSYYRIAIMQATSSSGLVNRTLMSDYKSINDTSFEYAGGIQGFTEIPVEEVYLNQIKFDVVRHLEQVENRLLMGNVDQKSRPYCSYQKLASLVTAEYQAISIPAFDYTQQGDTKNPNSYFTTMSYMGGEVYAFGIVYIFDDGTESPSYHLPGRPAAEVGDTGFSNLYDDRELLEDGTNNALYEDIQPFTEKDKASYIADYPTGAVERWRVYETAEAPDGNNRGLMAFHESISAEYIEKESCDEDTYWGIDGYPWSGAAITGKIRHHKFPNRNTIPQATNTPGSLYNTRVGVNIVFTSDPGGATGDVIAQFRVDYKYISDPGTTYTREINILRQADFVGGGYWTNYYWQEYWSGDIDHTSIVLRTSATGVEAALTKPLINTDVVGDSDDGLVKEDATNTYAEYYINGVQQLETYGNPAGIATADFYFTKEGVSGDGDYIQLLGIKFDNITLPEGAVDYRIVRAQRDDDNRTVLGKAFCGTTRRNAQFLTFNNLMGTGREQPADGSSIYEDFRNRYIYSPENLFSNKKINGSYLKWENYYDVDTNSPAYTGGTGVIEDVGGTDTSWFDNDGYDWEGVYRVYKYKAADVTSIPEENHRIEFTKNFTAFGREQGVNITSENDPAYGVTDKIRTLWNTAGDHPVSIVKLSYRDYLADPTYQFDIDGSELKYISYVSVNIERDIHSSLDFIKYYQTHNNVGTYSGSVANDVHSHTNFGGDTFISHLHHNSTQLQESETVKRVWDFVVKLLLAISAAALAVVTAIVTFGVATPLAVIALSITLAAIGVGLTADIILEAINTFSNEMENNPEFRAIVEDSVIDRDKYKDDTFINTMSHGYGTWVESDINVNLREASVGPWKGLQTSHTEGAVRSYLTAKCLFLDSESGAYTYLAVPQTEVFRFNSDLKRSNQEKVFFPIGLTYDCCSTCQESFPHRVYYSEKSFIEETFDSYGRVLPLNYIDIPGETGEISNVFTISNALYVHTQAGLWYIPQNIQERLTGDVISLVGTGGFFASPPRKIFDDEVGSGGSTQKLATRKLKYGVFFIDSKEGEPYLMNFSSQSGTQIQSLTVNNGMQRWFRENGKFILYDQIYQLHGIKIPVANPTNPETGIGYISSFDFQNNRILLTKRDYKIITGGGGSIEEFVVVDDPTMRDGQVMPPGDNLSDSTLAYNEDDGNFYTFDSQTGDTIASIAYTSDEDIFENKSFTISYSLDTNSWISFHSYLPKVYIYDRKNLMSVDQHNVVPNLWRHNVKHEHLKVYGEYKPFIIDFVVTQAPLQTSIYNNILLQTEAYIPILSDTSETEYSEERYITFNKAIFYNRRQCSGELLLNPTDMNPDANFMMRTVKNTQGQISIKKFDKNWRISNFRDMRLQYDNKPVFHTAWSEIKNDYFIDKVPNLYSISVNKSWQQREFFRDKYLGVRLIFENSQNIKLISNYSITTEKSTDV